MNDEQFSRTLQSVGQSCFVKYFDVFSSKTLSREDIIEKLKSETNYTDGSCVSRTGHAQSIINAGLAKKALEAVISSQSTRILPETREKAQSLLVQLNT
ncbi:hypothetical protein [Pseudoalteromonas sp. SCQQ13]|uniref:hypothetical protein n=1 Tax=Pseudoalteromonas sp. SCQQ13 TaxID=2792066 RepID=UPI0018CDFDA8|nr:hypothetical protein [Pseudoalteromonas sp. SCQQ13]MBH0094585.1 hypothetical protein [Pseudoalteromonas sp. SCQQ13]